MTNPSTTTTACIALGSNLGDRGAMVRTAIESIDGVEMTRVVRVSSFHETEPVGGPPGQGKYLNAAAVIETELGARRLLEELLSIEASLGRARREGAWNEARTIDLDLILFGDQVIDEPGLLVPHPRMHERGFVLEPMAEIAGDAVHPVMKRTVRELRNEMRAQTGTTG